MKLFIIILNYIAMMSCSFSCPNEEYYRKPYSVSEDDTFIQFTFHLKYEVFVAGELSEWWKQFDYRDNKSRMNLIYYGDHELVLTHALKLKRSAISELSKMKGQSKPVHYFLYHKDYDISKNLLAISYNSKMDVYRYKKNEKNALDFMRKLRKQYGKGKPVVGLNLLTVQSRNKLSDTDELEPNFLTCSAFDTCLYIMQDDSYENYIKVLEGRIKIPQKPILIKRLFQSKVTQYQLSYDKQGGLTFSIEP